MTRPVKGHIDREAVVDAQLEIAPSLDALVFNYIWIPAAQSVDRADELLEFCIKRELQ